MFGGDPDRALSLLADAARATDPRLRELARRLASRLVVDIARRGRVRRRGVGLMETQRYRPDGGDVDIDSSMEALSGRAAGQGLDVDALRLRAWSRPTAALCLLIDSSGSMRGRSLATAALAAAAVALRAPAAHAVLSFSSNVIVIKGLHEGVSVERVVDDVLALRGKGTTDLAAALQEASAQLRGARAARAVTLLVSDCRANTPGDVVSCAAALDELLIVAPSGDDADAIRLANRARARIASVDGPSALPAALSDLLG